MKYRVYIAAPFAARDGLRDFAHQLTRIGMDCTSLWLLDESDIQTGVGAASERDTEEIRKEALGDLSHIDKADAIVQFTGNAIEALRIPDANGPMLHSGGRQVELGYALARNKTAIVIGHPENIFQRTLATVVPNWHEAVLELVALRIAAERDEIGTEAAS